MVRVSRQFQRWWKRAGRWRRPAAVVLPAVVIGSLVATGGTGAKAPRLTLNDGSVWLASDPVGQATLLDGTTAQVETRVAIDHGAGQLLAVSTSGVNADALLAHGLVSAINGTTDIATHPTPLLPGATTSYDTLTRLYLLNPGIDGQAASLETANPATLQIQSHVPLPQPVTSETLDSGGQLWMTTLNGNVYWSNGTRIDHPAHPINTASLIGSSGGTPVVVQDDTATPTVTALNPATGEPQQRACINAAVADPTLQVGASPPGSVYVTSSDDGALLTANLTTNQCPRIHIAAPGNQLGPPIAAQGRIFVPDYTTGDVMIADISIKNDVPVTVRVLRSPRPKSFQLLTQDGIVYYNNPHGPQAGVITVDGRVHPVTKYNPHNPNQGLAAHQLVSPPPTHPGRPFTAGPPSPPTSTDRSSTSPPPTIFRTTTPPTITPPPTKPTTPPTLSTTPPTITPPPTKPTTPPTITPPPTKPTTPPTPPTKPTTPPTPPTKPTTPPPAVPSIVGLSETSGPSSGGLPVTITVTNLAPSVTVTSVDFGSNNTHNIETNGTSIVVRQVPPGTGTVDVRLETTAGTSPVTAQDRYSYLAYAIGVASPGVQECALLDTRSVDCWGYNGDGGLGNGTTNNSSTPVPVSGITNATAVSDGGGSACALLTTGAIDCWGYNGDGELGDGATTGPDTCYQGDDCSTTPVPVTGITDGTAISAGPQAACALLTTGAIDCWGFNDDGGLGNGTTNSSYTPVTVSGITNATAISVGSGWACALLSAGTVDCWGYNGDGELGNGTTTGPARCSGDPCSTTPVPVTGITNATAISAAGGSACALLTTGAIDCWGFNGDAELGNGTNNSSSTPVAVSGITNATAIGVGSDSACALLTTATVACWGDNRYGELGNGTTNNSSDPKAVSGIPAPT